jgi:Subtilase family
MISRKPVLQACLAIALFAACGDFALRIGGHEFGVVISQAHADDDGDDGGGDDAGGGTGGGSTGDSGSSDRGLPFTWFSPSDREPNELVAAGLTRAQLNTLRQQGYSVIRERNSRLLSNEVLRLRIPSSLRLNAALEQVRRLAPNALVDYNHLFRPSACNESSHQCPLPVRQLVGWGGAPSCNVRATLGLIDTTVDTSHPALRGQSVQVLRVRSSDREASNSAHGTAVASLLVGRSDSPTPGLVPRARLLAADAFHRAGRGDDRMDAFDFAAALDALTTQGVGAINLSFAGPANVVIERSIARAYQRGVVLVAAVGNDGPTASPRFPAAYAQVIAVTAVRSDMNVFRRAVRGEHVALAAPGVDVWAAQTADARSTALSGPQTGTSMAAPFVTAAVAVIRSNGAGKGGPAAVRVALLKQTKDLGAPGIDPIFGHGLLQMGQHCSAPTAALKLVTKK